MDRKWLPLNALRAFEAAGQHLSFTAAANSLTVAQSAVSRHVIVLENFLGVALFERRPQQLVLTEAGRHILPVVSKSFDRIDQALGEVIKEKGRPKRVLKVALPTSFAYRLAIPILRDFRAEHPGISLEIVSKPTAGPEMDGDIDIAIVYTEPRVTDAIHDLLWMVRATILCSPKLLQTIDRSDPAKFIASCDLLHVKFEDRPRHFFWEMLARSIGRPDLAVDRGLVFDTPQLAAQYAMLGDGLALADPLAVRGGDQGRTAGAPVRYLARRGLRLLSDHPPRGPQQRGGRAVPLMAHRAFLRRQGARKRERGNRGAGAASGQVTRLRRSKLACPNAIFAHGVLGCRRLQFVLWTNPALV